MDDKQFKEYMAELEEIRFAIQHIGSNVANVQNQMVNIVNIMTIVLIIVLAILIFAGARYFMSK